MSCGAVVWDCAAFWAKTGDTVNVPAAHTVALTATVSWSTAWGGVTSILAAVGQAVSVPVGTSE